MLTRGDLHDCWPDKPRIAEVVADFLLENWRGARIYLPRKKNKQTCLARKGANIRLRNDLERIVRRTGGGDKEIEMFYEHFGGGYIDL